MKNVGILFIVVSLLSFFFIRKPSVTKAPLLLPHIEYNQSTKFLPTSDTLRQLPTEDGTKVSKSFEKKNVQSEITEEDISRLAQIISSEEFIKRALQMEKESKLPDLNEQDLIADEEIGESNYKKYRQDGREYLIGGDENQYSEAVYTEKGEPLLVRNFLDGQLRHLQIKMQLTNSSPDEVLGTHSIAFDLNGEIMNIYSDMGDVQIVQKISKGKVVERSYLKVPKNNDVEEMTYF